MEIIAGFRTKRDFTEIRPMLLGCPMLPVGGLDTYELAASILLRCRSGGETIRHSLDCVIAAVAIREGAHLLHCDRDFDAISRHTDLKIYPVAA